MIDICPCGTPYRMRLYRKTNNWAPIETEPSSYGNVRVAPGDAKHYAIVSGAALAEARQTGERLYLNHFAVCPRREEFRRHMAKGR